MRGNVISPLFILPISYFNSRLCMRGNILVVEWSDSTRFQFTPLHERQQTSIIRGRKHDNFNSRLCMRGNVNTSVDYWATYLISIHASAWEATEELKAALPYYYISIHASAWEATWVWNCTFTDLNISIHASAWEATFLRSLSYKFYIYFNSRLCMRGNIVFFQHTA